jgi:hypothetical protein
VQAAFGCNYQGDITPAQVISTLEDGFAIAEEYGQKIERISLADTMGWAAPHRIERVIGEVRSRWPDQKIGLHLHDTRGLAVANAHAGLKMGVAQFDSTVGGLGGCPFAGQKGAAGNICTEELVMLCQEMGIETGRGPRQADRGGTHGGEDRGARAAERADPCGQPGVFQEAGGLRKQGQGLCPWTPAGNSVSCTFDQ